MAKTCPEHAQALKQKKDKVLAAVVRSIPYLNFMGISFDRRGDELTAIIQYNDSLIGNPALPALHGGAIAAFLEVSAIIELSWKVLSKEIEASSLTPQEIESGIRVEIPKTIDFTVDYLRTGLPRDAYARARITRSGRRYSSVLVEAWQEKRSLIFAQAIGHFVVPFVELEHKA